MDYTKITTEQLKEIFTNHKAMPAGTKSKNSVMVLLFEIDGELNILYNKRSSLLKHQPGDICFPGGSAEGDETPLETAYRETYEELKIPKENIEIIGQSDYFVSNFGTIVFPFVGIVKNFSFNDIVLNEDEVESAFLVPISYFKNCNPIISNVYYRPEFDDNFPFHLIVNGRNYKWRKSKTPQTFYQFNEYVIWGLTARITRNILEIIEDCNI